jgi:hypothetical protein
VDSETLVFAGEGVEVLLEKNVLGLDVGEDKVDLGAVTSGAATDDGTDDLEHGGDAGAAGNHAEVADHVGGVDKGALGAADADRLADAEGGHVFGDVAGRVRLDEQVEVARLVVAGDGRVGAHDLLSRAILLLDGCADGDVLANGETEDSCRGGELEPVAVDRALVFVWRKYA